MIEQMLEYNKQFVETKAYEKYQTSKYPDKKIAIVTCMDTRLVERTFIKMGCKFQDQGGIFIGNDCLIGHKWLRPKLIS